MGERIDRDLASIEAFAAEEHWRAEERGESDGCTVSAATRRAIYDTGRTDAIAEALARVDGLIAEAEATLARLEDHHEPELAVCVLELTRLLGDLDGLKAARAAIAEGT